MSEDGSLGEHAAFTLVRGGEVFAPKPMGRQDILLSGGKIVHIAPRVELPDSQWTVDVVDATGMSVVPGFIDQHLHIAGGGGIWGPHTRSPQLPISSISAAGITCVVSCLGADNITRQMPELLMRCLALEGRGLTTYAYSGGYQWPLPTVTGKVGLDVALVDRILGVKIAVSEARASPATTVEILRVVADTYVAGQVSGKPGVIHIHVGDGPTGIQPVVDIIDQSGVPSAKFIVTHMNRSQNLLDQAIHLARNGVWIDITTAQNPALGKRHAVKPSQAILHLLDMGIPLEQITISSDSGGSVLVNGSNRGRESRRIVTPAVTLPEIRDLIVGLSLEQALRLVCTNPARALCLDHRKGEIREGYDADVVLLDHAFAVQWVLAKGQVLVAAGQPVIKGPFEP